MNVSSTARLTLDSLLTRMAAYGDRHYDPEYRMVKLPTRRNVHMEHFLPEVCHPVRDSLYYAMVLLERAGAGDVARANEITRKVCSLQAGWDPADTPEKLGRLHGLWHYVAEEAVTDWPFVDYNWADFNGLTLLFMWHLKSHLLEEETRQEVLAALGRAGACIRARNVTMAYTNIAIKGTFVTLAIAELLEDAELMEYAVDRVHRLRAEISKTESFAEYNSPTYMAISLAGLMAIDQFVRHPKSRAIALELQHRLWRHVARHFHAPTQEMCGPHSRAYHIRLHDAPHLLGTMLLKASGGKVVYPEEDADREEVPFEAFFGYFLEANISADAQARLLDMGRREMDVETVDLRERVSAWWRPLPPMRDTRDGSVLAGHSVPAEISTYLCPAFCLGTVNLQDGWEQRQNLIAYWPSGGRKPGYLRHRYLHDDRPYCAGTFAARQSEGRVLCASFLLDYTDTHPSVPAEEISAEFLGTVLDLDNEGQPVEAWLEEAPLADDGSPTPWLPGQILWVKLPRVWIALRLLEHRSEPVLGTGIVASVSLGGSRIEARMPHFQGARRTLRWTDLDLTHTAYALWMDEPVGDWAEWQRGIRETAYEVALSGGLARAALGELRLGMPTAPIPREILPEVVEI